MELQVISKLDIKFPSGQALAGSGHTWFSVNLPFPVPGTFRGLRLLEGLFHASFDQARCGVALPLAVSHQQNEICYRPEPRVACNSWKKKQLHWKLRLLRDLILRKRLYKQQKTTRMTGNSHLEQLNNFQTPSQPNYWGGGKWEVTIIIVCNYTI